MPLPRVDHPSRVTASAYRIVTVVASLPAQVFGARRVGSAPRKSIHSPAVKADAALPVEAAVRPLLHCAWPADKLGRVGENRRVVVGCGRVRVEGKDGRPAAKPLPPIFLQTLG